MTPSQLLDMNLHDEFHFELSKGDVTILRVLTGWIYFYFFEEMELQESVYVPEKEIALLKQLEDMN